MDLQAENSDNATSINRRKATLVCIIFFAKLCADLYTAVIDEIDISEHKMRNQHDAMVNIYETCGRDHSEITKKIERNMPWNVCGREKRT